MTLEISGAQVFGVLMALISTFGGVWLKRLNAELAANRERVEALARELSGLRETLAREASDYSRRAEVQEIIRRIEAKLDRLAEQLHTQLSTKPSPR